MDSWTKFFRGKLRAAPYLLYADTPVFKPLGGGDLNNQLFNGLDLPSLLSTVFTIALSVGAILAVLRIAFAGYLYMGSADMWSNKGKAKEVFSDAVIGLLILLGVWLILYQINPDILNVDIFRCIGSGTTGSTCPGAQ